jgi:hypothetical protein
VAATLTITGLAWPEARAASMPTGVTTVESYGYTSYGEIANQTGVTPISFTGVNGTQTLTTPGTFTVGTFDTLNILPTTATLTYNNTPYTIDLNVTSGTGTGVYTYVISGNLNGSISGDGTSNMVATVSSITGQSNSSSAGMTTPPFPVSDIQINVPQGINAPNMNTNSDGYTTLYGQVVTGSGPGLPSPAPEPASIAIFAVGLVGWGLRRRMIRSKSQTAD